MTSNASETLHSVFRGARRLPVASLVENTFYKCCEWFVERITKAKQWREQCPTLSSRVMRKLEKRGTIGRTHEITQVNPREFKVTHKHELVNKRFRADFEYVVIFQDHGVTCSCRKPSLTQIPCSHILSVCCHRNYNPFNYVNWYYSSEALESAWSAEFHCFSGRENWFEEETIIIPNPQKVNLGRRRILRLPMTMDEMRRRRAEQGRTEEAGTSRGGTTDNYVKLFSF